MGKILLTIGRSFGSGGSEIGKKVADKLGISYYDKELIKLAAIKSGINENLLKDADEKPVNSFLYSVVTHGFPSYTSPVQYSNIVTNDKVFSIQSDIIKNIAENESAVFIGRCADYILREYPDLINIFVYANKSNRARRISAVNNITEKEALDSIKKIDKERSSYYNFYTNKAWGECTNYDLCINSDAGVDVCVDTIVNFVKSIKEK